MDVPLIRPPSQTPPSLELQPEFTQRQPPEPFAAQAETTGIEVEPLPLTST